MPIKLHYVLQKESMQSTKSVEDDQKEFYVPNQVDNENQNQENKTDN